MLPKCTTIEHVNQLHARMITTGFIKNTALTTRLVLTFISSPHEPLVEFARYIFFKHHAFHFSHKKDDPFLWNAVIRSYSHGFDPQGALLLLCSMLENGAQQAESVVHLNHSPWVECTLAALPYKRTPPSWLKISSQDVEENICKFAKKGLTPSQIGVILRDSHGIAQVKSVTGSKILRILKAHGLAPEIPEDLYHLIKKAVSIRKHLERNRKDKDSKFRLILVESRIHRLARYYKKTKKLPPVWKYESTTASTLVA
ncbi:S15/NS1, RNA-binding [Sesbania bispinosa]|nr:S15/NS1, RNA-binding [Sesbania bispinosa]